MYDGAFIIILRENFHEIIDISKMSVQLSTQIRETAFILQKEFTLNLYSDTWNSSRWLFFNLRYVGENLFLRLPFMWISVG